MYRPGLAEKALVQLLVGCEGKEKLTPPDNMVCKGEEENRERSLQLRCGPRSRGWWLGKVGPPARPSASSRRAGLLQLENHYCNNALRSP